MQWNLRSTVFWTLIATVIVSGPGCWDLKPNETNDATTDAGSTDAGVEAPATDAGSTDAGVEVPATDAGSTDAGVEAPATARRVGPEGGQLEFPGDLVLDVPAGALDHEVDIVVRLVYDESGPETGILPLNPSIELIPDGTTFALPVRLTFLGPVDYSDSLVLLTWHNGAEDEVESLPFEVLADGRISATLWHFSKVTAYAIPDLDLPVSAMGACSTVFVRGLSDQIRRELLELSPGALVPVTHAAISWATPPSGRYAQPSVATAISAAVDDGSASMAPYRLQINAAWRSVADQYVLSHCGNGNITADTGTSHHLNGMAMDVQPMASKDTCSAWTGLTRPGTFDRVHPVWGPVLSRHDFAWFGLDTGRSVCGDRPHFDYQGSGLELRGLGVLAFQRVWNRFHPDDPIPSTEMDVARNATTGIRDDQITETLARLARAPIQGLRGRFSDNGDGTVSDSSTRLTWQRDAGSSFVNYADATNACVTSGLAGGGWRLPTHEELRTIWVSTPSENGALIDPVFFPNTNPTAYWTTDACGPTPPASSCHVIIMFFYGTYSYNQSNPIAVPRCVRNTL